MSDTKSTNQKERVSKVRHKPERESGLRRAFVTGQLQTTNTVQTSAPKNSAGSGGESAISGEKVNASEIRFAHDFTRIPAQTTQGLGGLRPGISTEDSPRAALGGARAGVSVDRGSTIRREGDEAADVKITTSNTLPAEWLPHGAFRWHVGFSTTGSNGWIVQRVTNTYDGVDSIGGDISNATVRVTPLYYEAWKVDGESVVSPGDGATNDMFERPDLSTDVNFMDPATSGSFSMAGKVYWTATNPAESGLTEGGVPDAGILLAGTSEPADLGVARLSRLAEGTWDSTVDPPTHTGSAA